MTWFPGFLSSALLPGILRPADGAAVCLVQAKFVALAKQRVAELSSANPSLQGRIQLVEGDITQPGLGLRADGFNEVTEAWHLAAAYDLTVAVRWQSGTTSRAPAMSWTRLSAARV